MDDDVLLKQNFLSVKTADNILCVDDSFSHYFFPTETVVLQNLLPWWWPSFNHKLYLFIGHIASVLKAVVPGTSDP